MGCLVRKKQSTWLKSLRRISEEHVRALLFGHEAIKELVAFQEEIVAAVGKEKMEITLLQIDETLREEVYAAYYELMKTALLTEEKLAREEIEKVKEILKKRYAEKIAALKAKKQLN